MNSFALYRLPHEHSFTLVGQNDGEPLQLDSCTALNDDAGFVVAPFQADEACPLLLIRPDVVKSFDYSEAEKCVLYTGGVHLVHPQCTTCTPPVYKTEREAYAEDFVKFFDELQARRLRKVVLSRCSVAGHDGNIDVFRLFLMACERYPRLFVALVNTPQSGCWLVATPEILLDGDARGWRTIALAGTMQLQGDELSGEGEQMRWSVKNIEEQRLVATYIAERLKPLCSTLAEEGPRTVRAANLVHLRSDFNFTLLNNTRVGLVLAALHPTPAVCGLPQDDARRFILANEQSARRYYSGFMGPLNIGSPSAHLYVSLRCMQITSSRFLMYAGGGLLRDSIEEQEWLETEAKLETIRRLVM